ERDEQQWHRRQRRETQHHVSRLRAQRFLREDQHEVRDERGYGGGDRAARAEAQHSAESPEDEEDDRRLRQIDEYDVEKKVGDVNEKADLIRQDATRRQDQKKERVNREYDGDARQNRTKQSARDLRVEPRRHQREEGDDH